MRGLFGPQIACVFNEIGHDRLLEREPRISGMESSGGGDHRRGKDAVGGRIGKVP